MRAAATVLALEAQAQSIEPTDVAASAAPATEGRMFTVFPFRPVGMPLPALAAMVTVISPSVAATLDTVIEVTYFDAVIAGYTAYLWARDGWPTPDGCFTDDGWIVAPP